MARSGEYTTIPRTRVTRGGQNAYEVARPLLCCAKAIYGVLRQYMITMLATTNSHTILSDAEALDSTT